MKKCLIITASLIIMLSLLPNQAAVSDAPKVIDKTPYEVEIASMVPVYYDIGLKEEWQDLVRAECESWLVEYELALAVAMQENRSFNPSLVSGTNDYGLFQINKVNHKRMAELGYTDMLDAEDNIKAGVYILSECLKSSDSYHEALMAYNLGRAGANRAMKNGYTTTSYSRGVMKHYNSLIDGVYKEIEK